MNRKPDDRIHPENLSAEPENPRIVLVVNGERFPRPGLETYFVDTIEEGKDIAETGATGRTCFPVMASYCQCNKVVVCTCQAVCVCEAVCTCESVSSSSRKYSGSKSGGTTQTDSYSVCTCDLVCTCDSACSCNTHTRSRSGSSSGRSGGGSHYGCRCAPVH